MYAILKEALIVSVWQGVSLWRKGETILWAQK